MDRVRVAGLFFIAGLLFLILSGCASQGGQNNWLPVSHTNTLRNAAELELNSLEDIKARVDMVVKEKVSPERLKELFGLDNLARWSETDTRNHFFPHSGVAIYATAKSIQECTMANKTYYAYVLDITAYTEKEVGNFLKNKLNFKVTSKKEGYAYWVMFVYDENNNFIHYEWKETPVYDEKTKKDRLGPLGLVKPSDVIQKPKVGF